jgi:hypothetical protein
MKPFPAKALAARVPLALAVVVLAVIAATWHRDVSRLSERADDQPPTVGFTWSPAGTVDLEQFRGHLTLKDDHALDFKTYKMTFVELGRSIGLPLADQLIGKEYDDANVYFSLIARDPKLSGKDKLTVQIEVADDAGQKTSVEKVISIKPPPFRVDPVLEVK